MPPGSVRDIFLGSATLCSIATANHGERGLTCFERAYRRADRINRLAQPGTRAWLATFEGEYDLCIMPR